MINKDKEGDIAMVQPVRSSAEDIEQLLLHVILNSSWVHQILEL